MTSDTKKRPWAWILLNILVSVSFLVMLFWLSYLIWDATMARASTNASLTRAIFSIDALLYAIQDTAVLFLPMTALIAGVAEVRAQLRDPEESGMAAGLLAVPLAPIHYCCLSSLAWWSANRLAAVIYGLLGFSLLLFILVDESRARRLNRDARAATSANEIEE